MVRRGAGHKRKSGLAGIAKRMLGARHPAAEQPSGAQRLKLRAGVAQG
jgi:hypothetical protein